MYFAFQPENRTIQFVSQGEDRAIFLGLDIGTSAVKALVVDADGQVVADTSSALSSQHRKPGWSEQNPDDWLNAVEACCIELSGRIGAKWPTIRAIGLSGQMHGAVLLGADKRPLRPAILWNDGRSTAQCDAINAAIGNIETLAGIFAMPGFTAPKVLWCAENEPEIHARIEHILLPKDYVRLWLTGKMAIDMADAAGTLWLDEAKRHWDEELCAASATKSTWLPRLMEGTEVSGRLTGEIAQRLKLPEGTVVAAGGGDAAAGALGIGAINEGDAFASLGTSGQLFVATRTYRPAPGTALHCFAHCLPDRWFQMACMLNGASPMNWFSSMTGAAIPHLLGEAEQAANVPLFLPYLTGERTPHNDSSIRGGFYGLGPDTDRGACMQAIVDAIAYTFCDANACLKQAGTDLSSIAAIGGGTRSDLVLQTMADAMGISIHRYRGSETGPALGAARLAMVASGDHKLEEVAATPGLEKVFEPRSERQSHHEERLGRWRDLYQTLRPYAAR